MSSIPSVLIHSHFSTGGIAEHTYYQATALEKAGAKVICLVPRSFLNGRKTNFETIPCLPNPFQSLFGLGKKIGIACVIIWSRYILAFHIITLRPDLVLLDSYLEYLSPMWIAPHIFLSKFCGISYAANLHDPVRNYQVGPLWWHKLSVCLAYLPLDFVLVHDKLPSPSLVPSSILAVEVPVGVYEITKTCADVAEIRRVWGVRDRQKVFLSFGYVRDGKNLDLVIKALAQVPEAFVVIAGSVASENDRPFSYYSGLASKLQVDERCRFFEEFVADEALGGYFEAADFVLLTYSSKFHSQSGILNIAVRARKPVLASASASPLIESVRNYSLGVTVCPDSLDFIVQGMRSLIENAPVPKWEEYEAAASWDLNAKKLIEAAKCVADNESKRKTTHNRECRKFF